MARRLLTQLGLDDVYEGNTEVDGQVVTTEVNKKKYYVDEVDEDKRPFRCLLDVGCRPTTTGCRIFGALKGAADGGLDIPHSEKRFPGYDRDAKEYDADMHRERIMGGHVGEYMEYLDEEVRCLVLCEYKHLTLCLPRITPNTKNILKPILTTTWRRMGLRNFTKKSMKRFVKIPRPRKRRNLRRTNRSSARPN